MNDYQLRKRIKNYISSIKPNIRFETIEQQMLYDMDDDTFMEITRTNRNMNNIVMNNYYLRKRYESLN